MYVSRLSEEELGSDDAEPRREVRFIPQNARGAAIIQSLLFQVQREVIFSNEYKSRVFKDYV